MTPTAALKVCGACGHWLGGQCRRYPPQMALWPTDNQHPVFYTPHPTFPDRNAGDIACGEWRE